MKFFKQKQGAVIGAALGGLFFKSDAVALAVAAAAGAIAVWLCELTERREKRKGVFRFFKDKSGSVLDHSMERMWMFSVALAIILGRSAWLETQSAWLAGTFGALNFAVCLGALIKTGNWLERKREKKAERD